MHKPQQWEKPSISVWQKRPYIGMQHFILFPKYYLTHSHTMTPFDTPGNKPFENTVGKREIARNEQFLLFPQCFLLVWITFCHFRQI